MDDQTNSVLGEYISWEEYNNRINYENISVFCLNSHSLTNKFAQFQAHLEIIRKRFTFIFVVETWLKPNTDFALELPGYRSESVYRLNQKGGSIKLFYLDGINASVIDVFTLCTDGVECLTVCANVPNLGKIYVSGFYRIPNRPLSLSSSFLEELLNFLHHRKSIICGDFNHDLSCYPLASTTKSYFDQMISFGFNPQINLKTYVPTPGQPLKSGLDHVWHNFDDPSENFVLTPSFSDHCPVAIVFRQYVPKLTKKVAFRDYSIKCKTKFIANIDNEFSRYCPPTTNVNQYSDYFIDFITKIQNKYFPIRTKVLSEKRYRSPWINSDVLRCIRKKHLWFKLLKRKRISRHSYTAYCKALNEVLKIAEEEYFERKFSSLKSNPKKNWKLLNDLLGRTKQSTDQTFIINEQETNDPTVIAQSFNDYFISYPKDIQEQICGSSLDFSNLIPRNPNTMYLFNSTDDEVIAVINKIDKNGSLRDVSMVFIRLTSEYIAPIICDFFNFCLERQTYPDILKIAKVTPIHKKNSKSSIKNYRPISVLSNISKIFENLLFNRLESFFNRAAQLSKKQFGFRKNKNTEQAVIELVNRALPAIENKMFASCVFLDYKACFDTICRSILYEKLARYGVRGRALDFVKSYFEHRKQIVVYESAQSNILTQNLGVVQGSKCGPLFFDIYSSEFSILCEESQHILYADDTCIVCVANTLESLTETVNRKLKLVSEWCRFNKICLEPSKSKFILISNRLNVNVSQIKLDGELMEEVNSFKYLGIMFDNKLKFQCQIDLVNGKLSRFSGITYRLSSRLNLSTAKNLYFSCVQSCLMYCLVVWGGVSLCSHRCDRTFKLQRRIVKNLFSRHFHGSDCIFKCARILKFTDVYRLLVSLYMYKILKCDMYPSIKNSLQLTEVGHSYSTRFNTGYVTPFVRVETLRMNYKYQFINIWNNIPLYIKTKPSISSFKNALTDYFLGSY